MALTVFYIAGATDLIRERFAPDWVAVALRVLSGWIAALAILMLACTLRGAPL